MRVFIGNIPCSTNNAELRYILYKCLTRSLWRQFKLAVFYRFDVRRDVKLKIVQQKRLDGIACYGVAQFDPPEVGRLSIPLIRKYVLNGKRLAAHEFVHRAYANERRAVGSSDKIYRGGERRNSDRRGARQRLRSTGTGVAKKAQYLSN